MQDDIIPPHRHVDVTSVDDAISILDKHGERATVIAGNTDEMEWMKNRSRAPEVVVDLKEIDELRGIEKLSGGGVRIGGLTTLSDVVDSELLSGGFDIVSEAAEAVATPQIRNMGTIGGNLSQDSRCWYYREDFDCYRAGGNTCYAATGDASEHSVTNYSRCITANPSDVAPTLVALDAKVVIEGPRGERTESVADFFVGPETNITVMNSLSQTEILKEIRIPGTWRNADTYFEKARTRESWDFALVNMAAAVKGSDTVSDVRLVSNGLAPVPHRLTAAERSIFGRSRSESNIEDAAESVLPNADPFEDNEYKIPLTENLVRRALTQAN